MRSRGLIVFGFVGLLSCPAAAQTIEQDATPRLEDLRAPSTPAVVVLGTSPTSIERPDNPKAFIVNLATRIATDDGVPTNYGVAVTPYWMRWHPRLTFDSYAKPTFVQGVVRTLSLSLASSDWIVGQGTSKQDFGSRIAVGLSSVLYQGRVNPRIFELRADLEENLRALIRAMENRQKAPPLGAMMARRKELEAKLNQATEPDDIVKAFAALTDLELALKALIAAQDRGITALHAERRKLATEIGALDSNRNGARVGVAAAWSWSIPNDVLADGTSDRQAVWITPSYRWSLATGEANDEESEDDQEVVEENEFGVPQPVAPVSTTPVSGLESGAAEIVGAVRYLEEPEAVTAQSTSGWDFGTRLVWQIRNEIAVSGEVVKRVWRSDTISDTYRVAAIFEARLGQSAYVFAAFGRDYEEKGTRSTLVSLVGINIGVGSKPVLTY